MVYETLINWFLTFLWRASLRIWLKLLWSLLPEMCTRQIHWGLPMDLLATHWCRIRFLALVTTSMGFNATPPLRFMCYLLSQGISLSIKYSNPDTKHVSRLLTSVSQGLRRPGRSFIYFRDTRIYTTKWVCCWCGFGLTHDLEKKTVEHCWPDQSSVTLLTIESNPFPFFMQCSITS